VNASLMAVVASECGHCPLLYVRFIGLPHDFRSRQSKGDLSVAAHWMQHARRPGGHGAGIDVANCTSCRPARHPFSWSEACNPVRDP
jgi:hypothetical protein